MWWNKKKEPEFKDSDFEILYYPLSGLYCPKYKGYYLRKTYPTNIIYTEDYYVVASYCKSKEEAERLIDLFKEQSLNINIEKLNYVSKNPHKKSYSSTSQKLNRGQYKSGISFGKHYTY